MSARQGKRSAARRVRVGSHQVLHHPTLIRPFRPPSPIGRRNSDAARAIMHPAIMRPAAGAGTKGASGARKSLPAQGEATPRSGGSGGVVQGQDRDHLLGALAHIGLQPAPKEPPRRPVRLRRGCPNARRPDLGPPAVRTGETGE